MDYKKIPIILMEIVQLKLTQFMEVNNPKEMNINVQTKIKKMTD